MNKVRVRNIDYALTGSVDIEGRGALSFRIEPNTWTEVPDEIYTHLKAKFANPRRYEVPNSLPDRDGIYRMDPNQTRLETSLQYLVEFA